MPASNRIAAPYAAALFGLALEKNNTDNKTLEAIYTDLQNLKTLCEQSRDFLLFVRSPVLMPYHKAEILKQLLFQRVQELTLTFVQLLARKGRAAVLPLVANTFEEMYLDHLGEIATHLRISHTPSDALQNAFAAFVQQLTNKKPRFDVQTDTQLMGGFVLRIGYRQLDRSVRTQLQNIEKHLRQPALLSSSEPN